MRTVPIAVAEIAVTAGVAPAAAFTACGRYVGRKVEIDLDALDTVDPAAVAWAGRYWDETCALWDAWAERRVDGDVLAVRRPLVASVQVDSKKAGRHDLRSELDALESYAGFSPLLDALLGATFDADAMGRAAGAWRHRVDVAGNRVSVTVWVTEPVAWPDTLGGAAAPGEVARVFTLVAQHAAWRDRKVRRLVEVRVDAEELWPAPELAD